MPSGRESLWRREEAQPDPWAHQQEPGRGAGEERGGWRGPGRGARGPAGRPPDRQPWMQRRPVPQRCPRHRPGPPAGTRSANTAEDMKNIKQNNCSLSLHFGGAFSPTRRKFPISQVSKQKPLSAQGCQIARHWHPCLRHRRCPRRLPDPGPAVSCVSSVAFASHGPASFRAPATCPCRGGLQWPAQTLALRMGPHRVNCAPQALLSSWLLAIFTPAKRLTATRVGFGDRH